VSTTAPSALPKGRLARSQEARRARILAAVLELASEGGYEAIQLRGVSERTGIGLDTIYRYFESRTRLISAALTNWGDREFYEPYEAWAEGETPAERLLSICRHVWEVWERNPNMLETFVRTALDEGDIPGGLRARALGDLMPRTAHALEGVDPAYREDVLMMVEHATHSCMTNVVRGLLRVDEVYPLVERTVRRLAQHPAMAGHRPRSWEWTDPAEG
jgi:AcrR family transcriptional regulator